MRPLAALLKPAGCPPQTRWLCSSNPLAALLKPSPPIIHRTHPHSITRVLFCSDTCWSVGNIAHIKSFVGAFWSFSLVDETTCKEFVESVRLGISACLTDNLASGYGNGSSISIFHAEQPLKSPLQPVDSGGLVESDDFSSISLGKTFGGSASPHATASTN